MTDQAKKSKGEKVYLISLGCAKNRVDSEHILGILAKDGYRVCQEIQDADVAVINTCGFVQDAVEEAIGVVLEVSGEKRKGRLKRVIVAGCLVQRYGYKLARELPEVDGWLGTGEIGRVAEMIAGRSNSFLMGPPGFLGNDETPRLGGAPFYSASIKIAEGCNHRCTYCTIPRIRGPFRSRPVDSIVREAKELVGRGVVEICLVAQDTTMYGRDLGKRNRLEDLLVALLGLKELGWVRIMYAHPHRISEGLLDIIEQEERVCPYLDIPLQHVHPKVLRGMGRANCLESPWRLIDRIRRRRRAIAIRTTLMVGFPEETEGAFQELFDFVRWASLDHLGVFVFSPEQSTPAARLASKVEKPAAHKRRERLMRLQAAVSAKKNRAFVGRTLPVLVEGASEETDLLLTGRTSTMAPEVDGRVFIRKGVGTVGRISRVLIRRSHVYDLIGEFA